MSFEIDFQENPSHADLQALKTAYDYFTQAQIGIEDRQEIAFFIRDENGTVVGGVKGSYGNYGWLWIDLLWVSDELRGQGYGSKLMSQIENEAKQNGCTNAYLNSFSFQAPEFYKKIGYTVFAELENFPEQHKVCCLRKKLS